MGEEPEIALRRERHDEWRTTPVERAKFIVDTIRLHLAREACKLHAEDLSSIEALLGREVRWCPSCGTRLEPTQCIK